MGSSTGDEETTIIVFSVMNMSLGCDTEIKENQEKSFFSCFLVTSEPNQALWATKTTTIGSKQFDNKT